MPEWTVAKERASTKDLAVFVMLTKSEISLLKNFKRTMECFRLRFILEKFLKKFNSPSSHVLLKMEYQVIISIFEEGKNTDYIHILYTN